MKKVFQHLQKRLHLVVVACLASFGTTNCEANAPKIQENPYTAVDSLMRSELSDSIADIILHAKAIKAERISVSADSITVKKIKKLTPEQVGALKYVFATSEIHAGEKVPYHHFSPSVKLTFVNKKKSCVVYFELGSKQMYVCDNKDNALKVCGYSKSDFTKICNIIFTKDEFLTFLLNHE